MGIQTTECMCLLARRDRRRLLPDAPEALRVVPAVLLAQLEAMEERVVVPVASEASEAVELQVAVENGGSIPPRRRACRGCRLWLILRIHQRTTSWCRQLARRQRGRSWRSTWCPRC